MSVSKGVTCSIFINSRKFNVCGDCLEACAEDAITIHDIQLADQEACICCGKCVEVCPQGAPTLKPGSSELITL